LHSELLAIREAKKDGGKEIRIETQIEDDEEASLACEALILWPPVRRYRKGESHYEDEDEGKRGRGNTQRRKMRGGLREKG
jgi:hypothetical protein